MSLNALKKLDDIREGGIIGVELYKVVHWGSPSMMG
jgi:hypothetical protein